MKKLVGCRASVALNLQRKMGRSLGCRSRECFHADSRPMVGRRYAATVPNLYISRRWLTGLTLENRSMVYGRPPTKWGFQKAVEIEMRRTIVEIGWIRKMRYPRVLIMRNY